MYVYIIFLLHNGWGDCNLWICIIFHMLQVTLFVGMCFVLFPSLLELTLQLAFALLSKNVNKLGIEINLTELCQQARTHSARVFSPLLQSFCCHPFK
jgi:hypothetical protein